MTREDQLNELLLELAFHRGATDELQPNQIASMLRSEGFSRDEITASILWHAKYHTDSLAKLDAITAEIDRH